MNSKLRSVLLGVITGVWATNMIVPIFNPNYQPPAELNGVFTVVAGGIVATFVQNNRRGGGGRGGNSNGSDGDN